MAKRNGKKQKQSEEASKVRRAERKLAKALAEVEEARAKVAKRERKLSALLGERKPSLSTTEPMEDTGIQGDEVAPSDDEPDDADSEEPEAAS